MDETYLHIELTENSNIQAWYVDIGQPNKHEDEVQEEEEEENFSCCPLDFLKPRIVTPLPKKRISNVGETLTLVCITTVLFPADIYWLLNEKVIQPTHDGRIIFKNRKRVLIILSVNTEDAGLITCVTENRFGCDKTLCELQVH